MIPQLATFIATAGTFLSTYVLGTLTTTVAQTGITVDPTVANQVRQSPCEFSKFNSNKIK